MCARPPRSRCGGASPRPSRGPTPATATTRTAPLSSSDLPRLTSRQVKEVDALAQARFGISVEWLMEAAGWQMARACPAATAVVCGTGDNAGDGLAAARHRHRWGKLAGVGCVDRRRLDGPSPP